MHRVDGRNFAGNDPLHFLVQFFLGLGDFRLYLLHLRSVLRINPQESCKLYFEAVKLPFKLLNYRVLPDSGGGYHSFSLLLKLFSRSSQPGLRFLALRYGSIIAAFDFRELAQRYPRFFRQLYNTLCFFKSPQLLLCTTQLLLHLL